MLSGLVEALAGDGGRLSLFSRQASAFPGVEGFDVDYHDEAAFRRALDTAIITAPDKRDAELFAKLDAVAGRVLKG